MPGTVTREATPDPFTASDVPFKAVSPSACLSLPAVEYAVVQRLRASPSALVLGDSGNLLSSATLPLEIFPDPDCLPAGGTMAASRENLVRAGLDRIFTPDPERCIASVQMTRSGVAWAHLLVKASPGEMPETLGEIQRTGAPALEAFACQVGDVALRYEWEILSRAARSTRPCVIIDENDRVVAVSPLMCEILGRSLEEMVGCRLDNFIQLDMDTASVMPDGPEPVEFTTSVLLKPLFLFFSSNLSISRISTVCGRRAVLVFHDLCADRRTGNSNIMLIQKISSTALLYGPPQDVIRKILNLMVMTLGCDLACVLRRKQGSQMIITPHSSRRIDMLRANVIEGSNEPLLEPFFARGSAVYCDNVEEACPEGSFFRTIPAAARFALVPVGDGVGAEYAVLTAWSNPDVAFASQTVPLLKILANLLGTVLMRIRLVTDNEQEKENLRRYTRLTAGRETRMAALKRENAQLAEVVRQLGSQVEDRIS